MRTPPTWSSSRTITLGGLSGEGFPILFGRRADQMTDPHPTTQTASTNASGLIAQRTVMGRAAITVMTMTVPHPEPSGSSSSVTR